MARKLENITVEGCQPSMSYQGVCHSCSAPLFNILPFPPLYDLETSAGLVPMEVNSLRNWLTRNKAKLPGLPIYRKDPSHRVFRYLRASEVKMVRDHIYAFRSPTGKLVSMWEAYQTFLSPAQGEEGNQYGEW